MSAFQKTQSTQGSNSPLFSVKYKAQVYWQLLKLYDVDITLIILFSLLLCMFEIFHNTIQKFKAQTISRYFLLCFQASTNRKEFQVV